MKTDNHYAYLWFGKWRKITRFLRDLVRLMKFSHDRTVRPKFLAMLLIALGAVFLIGGFYTMGIWLPMFLVCMPLLISKSDNAIGIIPKKVFQISFLISVILGVVIHYFNGFGGAIGWYLTALVFSISFNVIRRALTALGFVGLS